MNALNSLLKMVVANQADELRLGVGLSPVVLTGGRPRNLTLAETGEQVLRQMLGGLLSAEAEASLARGATFRAVYDAGEALGVYRVELVPRAAGDAGFDVTLTNAGHAAVETAAETSAGALVDASPLALEELLERAAALRASDVHVRQGEAAFARVDGKLVHLDRGPHDIRDLLASVGQSPTAQRSVDVALTSPSAGRLRLHSFLTGGVPALAIRMLPPVIPTLSALGLPSDLQDLTALPNGLVLLTGPAGSGKSTTAAALCQDLIRQRSVMLLTLEDPVEYAFDASHTNSVVRQRQVGLDVPDFASGLRDALREDPDVLFIGEMRDAESIGLALTAAETGHLVFATLHSRGAASAIDRIVDAYPAGRQQQLRVQLSESLRAVVAQRLLPHARGTGRALAVEVLRRSSAVANLIREGKSPQLVSAMQSSRKEGMLLLERSLADLCRSGAIDERAAFAAANDQDALMEYLHPPRKP
jgi:twitching motility protein PilT